MEGSALILLLGSRNSPTPAHRAEASFEYRSFISGLADHEAWCSPPAVKLSFRVSGPTVTSISCRKRAHDATHLHPPFLPTPVSTSVHEYTTPFFIILHRYHIATERK